MGGRGGSSASAKRGGGGGISSAKTFDDMRQYMQSKYGITVTSGVDQLDFDTVKQGMLGIEDVLNELPQLAGNIKYLNADMGTSAYAYAQARYVNGQLEFSLNMAGWAYGNGTRMVDHLVADGSYHPANTTARTVMSHEVGHIAEFTLAARETSNAGSAIQMMEKKTVATKIVGDAAKQVKKTPEGKGKKISELIRSVSGYATTNRSEALAECVGDYIGNGSNSTALSKAVWGILKTKLG